MITLKNTQRTVPIDPAAVIADAQTILNTLHYADFDIGIWLCSNQTIKKYNKDYRGKDSATDILSFAYHPELKPGQRINVEIPEDKNLGDLIIAPLFVQNDLARWGQTFTERMHVLLVHGICHLLGYDHIDDADYKLMAQKEKSLLKILNKES